jgi:hypothetical protein
VEELFTLFVSLDVDAVLPVRAEHQIAMWIEAEAKPLSVQ